MTKPERLSVGDPVWVITKHAPSPAVMGPVKITTIVPSDIEVEFPDGSKKYIEIEHVFVTELKMRAYIYHQQKNKLKSLEELQKRVEYDIGMYTRLIDESAELMSHLVCD